MRSGERAMLRHDLDDGGPDDHAIGHARNGGGLIGGASLVASDFLAIAAAAAAR